MSKNIFEQALNNIPQDIQEEISWNFDIIDQITFILKKKGMSQKDLAILLGKKESEISKWMRGTHNFTLSTIWLLQKALGEKIIDTPLNLIKTQQEKEFRLIRETYLDIYIQGGKTSDQSSLATQVNETLTFTVNI